MHRATHTSRRGTGAFILGLGLILAASATQPARADGVLVGGVNGHSEGLYYYLGTILPLNGDWTKDGAVAKLWVYGTDFEYDAGFDDVDVDGYGGEVSIGYQKLFEHGRVAGFVGVTHRDLDLSPDDPDADGLERDTGIPLQVEGAYELTDRVGGEVIVQYTFLYDQYWGRLRPYTKLGPVLVGPEVILNGGDEYDDQYFGAFVGGIPLGFEGAGLELSGGLLNREGGHKSAYGSVSFSYAF